MCAMFAGERQGSTSIIGDRRPPDTAGSVRIDARLWAEADVWAIHVEAAREAVGILDDAVAERLEAQHVDADVEDDRYALRFTVTAADAAEATRIGLGQWWHLVESASLPAWDLVAISVKRLEQYGEPGHRTMPASRLAVSGRLRAVDHSNAVR